MDTITLHPDLQITLAHFDPFWNLKTDIVLSHVVPRHGSVLRRPHPRQNAKGKGPDQCPAPLPCTYRYGHNPRCSRSLRTCTPCNLSQTYPYVGSQQSFSSTLLFPLQSGISGHGSTCSSNAANGTVAALPVFPIIGKIGNPSLALMTAAANDISDGSTVTVASMYGSTHTYVAALNGTNNNGGFGYAAGVRISGGYAMGILLRYE
jgi:hypothetical protein